MNDEHFDLLQVVARGESSIEDDLLGSVTEHLDRTVRELYSLRGGGRAAAFYEAINDHPRGATGEVVAVTPATLLGCALLVSAP